MPLPLFPLKRILAFGLDESDLGDRLKTVAARHGVGTQADPEPLRNRFIRSDQYNFIRRGVPSLAFKFGYEPGSAEDRIHHEWTRVRYHAPSDDLQQPVDLEGAAQFNRILAELALDVANAPERPRWKESSFFKRYAH
jgi:Zn-dependent M28 family amino/carboxypeptidase